MKRERKPIKVSEILNEYFKSHRYIYYRVKMESAVRLWEKIEDPIVRANSKAITAKDGKLVVKTTSPSVSNELSLREKELLDRINNLIGGKFIKKIIFKSGFIGKNEKIKNFVVSSERNISFNVLKRIDELVKDIKDEDLKLKLKKLFIESYKSRF